MSLFEFDYVKNSILDLTMSKLYDSQNDDKFYDGAIFSWPLIAACMIRKPNDYEQGTKFISEYLFPQYVISLLTEHELTGIWGVKYFSTKFESKEGRFNIAIPIRKSKKSDHCDDLKSVFKYEYTDLNEYKYNLTIPKKISKFGKSKIDEIEEELLRMKKNDEVIMKESPLVEKFNQATLPKSEWTHEAHLSVALWYVDNYEFDDAICRLKSGIILLNKFHGTDNTDRSGYHETLTIFWAKVISIYIELNPLNSLKELQENLLKSTVADKQLPFHFYLREEILSSAYRAVYHEPTLQKLDEETIKVTLDS